MISYEPLFHLLLRRGMTKTQLKESLKFGTTQLAKMGKNEYVSLELIDRICEYLDCKVEEVIEFIPSTKSEE